MVKDLVVVVATRSMWLWVVMGLLISFGRGFGAEFWWWIMVGSVWWHGGSRAAG